MISLHNIRAIAKYETTTLLRSWFFRIFAILAMVVLVFFNIGTLIQMGGGAGMWALKGLPANIPYVNLLLLNVVQAIIAIFLASDFLKRDKKLDTTEVIYMRPMTNGEYVIGKTLGNLGVFIVLNLIILGIALIFNLIAKHTEVTYIAYLWYFLLISVPTLVFIMGLSFLVMSLIKNQAVTFVVLLGYVAISLFYLQAKFYYLFDYMAFNIPLTYSDFVGFGNMHTLLVHRGMYFFFGLSFILYTILLLKRLPHSEGVRYGASVLGTVCLLVALYLGYSHVHQFMTERDLRQNMQTLNESYLGNPAVRVRDYDIKLKHEGDKIETTAVLSVRNGGSKPIKKVIFSLNPGLKVSELKVGGQTQAFEQKLGIIELKDYELNAGDRAEIEFTYAGNINEAAAFLDIDDETREEAFKNFMYQIDKRYAFLTDDYVLLTRENAWYPVPGAGYGKTNSQWLARQFSRYKLEVTTKPGLTAISQGKSEQDGDTFRFESSHANSQISLVIGEYDRLEQNIDGLDFNIYTKKGHDYFSSIFEDIKDTIPELVLESLQDFERSLDMYYPFERFSLVEVPVQYYSYDRVLSGTREQMQPEMMLYAEKGVLVDEADFNGRFEGQQGFGPRDRQQDMTPEEKKIQVLKNFLSTFTSESGRPNFSRSGGQMQVEESTNTYFAFPLFYDYAYYISSKEWPVTDRVFEGYKKSNLSSNQMGWLRDMQGTSEDEQANMALLSNSLEELLKDPEQKQIIDNVIQLKGTSLFSIIKRKAGDDAFEDFLYSYLNRVKFGNASIEDFNDEVKSRFDIDLIPYMKDWFSSKELPAFLVGNVSAVNVLDGDQLKTMVKFKISNTEETEGIVSVEFRIGGGFGPGSRSSTDNITKLVHLDGNQTKEVSFLLAGTPRGGTINTLVSRNLPSEIRLPLDNIQEDPKAIPFEGEKVVDIPVRVAEDNEIILDNEDPGFKVSDNTETSLLKKLLTKDDVTTEKYSGMNNWQPPRSWTLTTNSSFYGTYVRSAYYIRSGSGDQIATWNIPITEAGFYDVYAYIAKMQRRGPGRNDNPGEYHYTVHHDDGDEAAIVDIKTADDGWNHLGAFYFSPDTAIVELSNENSGRTVIADAVKLVKQ
ncbi:golvesin C-terminal-like domain-containing protein [Mangrovibacterium diazotrophicum]|uniref:ABC-type transport system involved in multi-copper enzyme maturation permease subunit n=1 Tax=Mangrovibacterium diazotrophicum TaxID=1261403 RepID=A0A419WBH2_9BACT|nr:ABC transporter permease subunit [Mangrovibacterium diazotrophicum]RKD92815.1 ABC-type transport system involved in multi-copper enzyme maturation permease subunit [Mangrovibacterium diazotrophicum]